MNGKQSLINLKFQSIIKKVKITVMRVSNDWNVSLFYEIMHF